VGSRVKDEIKMSNNKKKVIGRREMLRRVGAGGLVAVAPACGGEGDDNTSNTGPSVTTNPSGDATSNGTSTATSPTGSVTSPPGATTSSPLATSPGPGPVGPTASSPGPMGSTATNGPVGPTATDGPVGPTATTVPTGDTAQNPGGMGGNPSTDGAGGAGGGTDTGAGGAGGGNSGPTMNGELEVPPWDDVPSCTASKTDGAGQGPFFIHNEEKDDDVDLFRQDIRGQYNPDAEEGIEMHLHLRILDSTSDACNMTPVAGVEVYIWHTDGQGYYSGFGNPGDQTPDEPYAGVPGPNDLNNADRFCRGAQVTDENGVVSFRSYFPGWYNGRDVHIHFVCLHPGTDSKGRVTYRGDGHVFTTQFYFEPELTEKVHKSREPYLRRTQGNPQLQTAWEEAIKADEMGNSELRAKATFENDLVVAQMQMVLDPDDSVVGGF